MREIVVVYVPWVLSLITLFTMWKAGDMWSGTWLVGIANQALWLSWIIAAGAWGFLPMNLTLWVIYWRNHVKWTELRSRRVD